MIGTGFAQYTITCHLGSGGMGDVYQATDTRLGRDVAVKFLSESFVHDSSRLARFQREARALAALNHPNIATIHGFEEVGGRHFLVMELVRGTTLASKLAGGRLALDDTIRYGTQIADALAAAHARGIVHRDLKPGNIMVTKSGVKVLDFGLAKSADHDDTLTRTEVVMGTPAYMAPEQREGSACDARSDIYSFGLILVEMATGRRIVDSQSWTGLPAPLARVIQGCLERDPDARWQSASDIKKSLSWVSAPNDGKTDPSRRWTHWAGAALVVGVAAGAAGARFLQRPPETVERVERFADFQSGRTALSIGWQGPDLALTPDGSRLVFVGNNGSQLFDRRLDSLEPAVIANGTRIQAPVISPNGQAVLYLDGEYVMTVVSIGGGSPVKLAANGRGGATWLDDETVVAGFTGPGRQGAGLRRINVKDPAAPEAVLTRVDATAGEAAHAWPHMLPDGRTILFTITAERGGLDAAQLAVFDLKTRQTKKNILLGGSGARYVTAPAAAREADGADGYVVYVAQRALWAIPFDLDRLATRGQARLLPVPLVTDGYGSGQFATAGELLAYVDAPGHAAGASRSIVWIDWSGQATSVGNPGPYTQVRVSPDEKRMAVVGFENGERDLRILDVHSQRFTRLRLDPVVVNGFPVWLPDSKRIAFQGHVTGETFSMWTITADGTGPPERLLMNNKAQLPTSASLDGYLVFHELWRQSETVDLGIMRMKLDPSRQVTELVQTKAWEARGVVSPNGRWIAYECCTEAQPEIHVSPYPNTGGVRWPISSGGGVLAMWSSGSDQLFYATRDGSLMRVAVDPRSSSWKADAPRRVLPAGTLMGQESSAFDISHDGRRVLTLRAPTEPGGSQPAKFVRFVQNWVEAFAPRAK